MPEQQNIEYKSAWRDDYLKWISAFANAQGRKLFIGINDNGEVIGVDDFKKWMDDIPNKVINLLGIMVDVNLHHKLKKAYIEINVYPSNVPISYHGVYYYRSGSTKQELKGNDLQNFLLKKSGKSWDALPIEDVNIKDIDVLAIKYFTNKAVISGRMANEAKSDSVKSVLQKLNLLTTNEKLTNAAILIFGKNPQRFFRQAYFKIGRFGKDDSDLLFQDIIEGNILEMADRVITILRSKYLTSPIHYNGLQRIETLEYPEEALREAILNAIVHKDYSGTTIQLSVYVDKLILWNEGALPENLSIKQLKGKHPSIPRNKTIAEVFFRAGFIEVWGRGISKINSALVSLGLPKLEIEEYAGGMQLTFKKKMGEVSDKVTENEHENEHKNEHENEHKNERIELLLAEIKKDKFISINKLADKIGVNRSTINRDLTSLKRRNRIKRNGPGKGGYWELIKF